MAFEDLAGDGVDADIGGLSDLDVDDVGLVDLDLGGDDAHVGDGHERGALGVLNAFDDGLAFAHRDVGHDAVKRGDGNGLLKQSSLKRSWATWLCQVPAGRVGLRLGLVQLGDGLRHRGHVECHRRPSWRHSPAWP